MNKILSCCSFLKDWVIAFPLSDIRFIYQNITAHIYSFCIVSFNVFMNVNITLFERYGNVFKYNDVLLSCMLFAPMHTILFEAYILSCVHGAEVPGQCRTFAFQKCCNWVTINYAFNWHCGDLSVKLCNCALFSSFSSFFDWIRL